MYPYNKVIDGISKYIDTEVITKVVGWQKWTLGTISGLMLSKGTNLFNELKENKIVKDLGIIDENDNIDIDNIYKELKKQADKGAITFNIPMAGSLTLNGEDVDKLYSYIKE